MRHHADQLLLESDRILLRIFADPFHADENIAVQNIPFAIVKRDNVGIGVVLQILLVDLQQVRIITKNIVHIAYFFVFGLNHLAYPKSI